MYKVLKDYVELLVSKVLLEYKDLLVLLVDKANVARKETKVFKVLLAVKAIVVNEVSVKGEKGIQGGNSDVLSVLADHLPIQLATRYGEKMYFIKYHVSEVVRVSWNCLEVWERYVMLAHTTNPRLILMLNLSMVKGMK